jgi:hypothetical protein
MERDRKERELQLCEQLRVAHQRINSLETAAKQATPIDTTTVVTRTAQTTETVLSGGSADSHARLLSKTRLHQLRNRCATLRADLDNCRAMVLEQFDGTMLDFKEELTSCIHGIMKQQKKEEERLINMSKECEIDNQLLQEEMLQERKQQYTMSLKVKSLEADNSALQGVISNLQTELVEERSLTAVLKHTLDSHKSPPKTTVKDVYDTSCSPFSPTVNRQLREANKIIADPQPNELEIQLLVKANQEHERCIHEHKEKLHRLETAIGNLQSVHAAEVKAVKHFYHVKDLIRVAKEREEQLHRDKLHIELNNLR